jgi:hypothetical protein
MSPAYDDPKLREIKIPNTDKVVQARSTSEAGGRTSFPFAGPGTSATTML